MKYTVTAVILFLLVIFSFSVSARKTTTTIGEWKHYSGTITFDVTDRDGRKKATIHVCDKELLDTNLFTVGTSDLKKIRSLIDETIQELEGGSNE